MYRRKQAYIPEVPKRFTLNITSMADMFTILLVFLLQNYTLHEYKIDPQVDLQMPISASFIGPKQAPILSIGKKEVLLNDQTLFSLQELPQKTSELIKLLAQSKSANPQTSGASTDSTAELIIQADKSHNYETMKTILQAVSQAGIKDVRLATLSGN